MYCQLHQEFTNDLNSKLTHAMIAISELRTQSAPKTKDFWDKVSASATLLSGLFVGLIGIFATATYNARELEAQRAEQAESIQVRRVEIVQKFFPHLVSAERIEQSGALLAIASLGDEKLATDLAKNFGTAASIDALSKLSASSDPSVARDASAALDSRLVAESVNSIALSIRVVAADENGPSVRQGSAFIVSTQGHAITAAHMFPEGADFEVSFSHDLQSPSTPAHLIQLDRLRDVALIRLKASPDTLPTPLEVRTGMPDVGEDVSSVGFLSRAGIGSVFVRGQITSTQGPDGAWLADLSTGPGFSGAPVVDSQARLIGFVLGTRFDTTGQSIGTLVRPIGELSDILKNANPL
ncbi:MAG: serine protease [Pseudomonadota bacterium]